MTEFGDKGDGITRRDFLDGVAITAAGLAAAAAAPHLSGAEALAASRGHGPQPLPPGYFPPTVTGLKGQPDHVVEDIMRIDGPPNQRDVHSTRGGPGIHVRHVRDSDETYDCVIVGAGASGLAAAKYYRDRFGENSRILLLDPLPDFGGHSHRNEFHVGPTTFLKNGGTVNLDSTGTWNQHDRRADGHPRLLRPAGGRHARLPRRRARRVPRDLQREPAGCARCCCSRPRTGARTRVVPNRLGPQDWTEWLATTPWSPEAQAAIVRIQTDLTTDWIAEQARPEDRPGEEGDPLPAHPEALLHGLHRGAGEGDPASTSATATACSARAPRPSPPATCGRSAHPGFEGLGLNLDPFPGIGRTPQFGLLEEAEESPSPTWPDGNSSLLRLLLDRLIPGRGVAPRRRSADDGERRQRRHRLLEARPVAATRSGSASTASCSASSRPRSARSSRRSTT